MSINAQLPQSFGRPEKGREENATFSVSRRSEPLKGRSCVGKRNGFFSALWLRVTKGSFVFRGGLWKVLLFSLIVRGSSPPFWPWLGQTPLVPSSMELQEFLLQYNMTFYSQGLRTTVLDRDKSLSVWVSHLWTTCGPRIVIPALVSGFPPGECARAQTRCLPLEFFLSMSCHEMLAATLSNGFSDSTTFLQFILWWLHFVTFWGWRHCMRNVLLLLFLLWNLNDLYSNVNLQLFSYFLLIIWLNVLRVRVSRILLLLSIFIEFY